MAKKLNIQIDGVGEHLPVGSFLKVVAKTVVVLRRLETNLSPSGVHLAAWELVEAKMSSPLTLTLGPGKGTVAEDASEQVVHAYIRGLRQLEESPDAPPYFDQEALRAVKSMLRVLNDGVQKIRYSAPGEQPVSPTLHAAANVRVVMAAASREFYEQGTIEGELHVVSTRKGDSCTIWEAFTNRRVACRLTEQQLEDAKRVLRQRVAVYGKIKYRGKGEPVSIEVESIRPLRTASQLPQPSSMGKIELTGGVPSEDHVRNLRDAD